MMKCDEQAKRAWDYVTKSLYRPETKLIYDHRAEDVSRFPTPDEAKRNYPNPCGYGTGMEDSMIDGGCAVDFCLQKLAKNAPDRAETLAFLHDVIDGMLTCAEAGKDGFLPRSLCISDRKSHYIDSSRDQYTLFWFGMHRFLASEYPTDAERARIAKSLTAQAERAVRTIVPETQYDYLREDGGPSLNCTMWGDKLGNHEDCRLPMLYLVTYQATGEERWLERYRSLRETAYAKSTPFKAPWHLYCMQQMQMAVTACYDLDTDSGWREKYAVLMDAVADYTYSFLTRTKNALAVKTDINEEFTPFRECELKIRQSGSEVWDVGNLPKLTPARACADTFFWMQDAANLCTVHKLCPWREVPADALALYEESFAKIDFAKHGGGSPVQYLEAYWLMK